MTPFDLDLNVQVVINFPVHSSPDLHLPEFVPNQLKCFHFDTYASVAVTAFGSQTVVNAIHVKHLK